MKGLACTQRWQKANLPAADAWSKITFPEFFLLFVQKWVTAREANERGRGPEDDNLE